jgi:hypothetical protein
MVKRDPPLSFAPVTLFNPEAILHLFARFEAFSGLTILVVTGLTSLPKLLK